MKWDQVRSEFIELSGAELKPLKYKFVKSRDAYERTDTTDRRGVYFGFVSSDSGRRSLKVWCGVKNHLIDEWFHKVSGVEKRAQVGHTTVNLDPGFYLDLNTQAEIDLALPSVRNFVKDIALPFLEKNYDLATYSTLLNDAPDERCLYHGNPHNRCYYGLISAKLACDPNYENLKHVYSDFLRTNSNGFYYPRFEKLIFMLESDAIQQCVQSDGAASGGLAD